MEDKQVREIAERIYSLFVVNRTAAGIQQIDGTYYTKYVPVSPFLIENMLLSQGSMGCYQQGYKTGYIKWVCLDFDCKDKENPDLHGLYDNIILPVIGFLKQKGIHYLTEFSGRRGIHVWIIFDSIISKKIGFKIVKTIINEIPLNIEEGADSWGVDLFPATDSYLKNIVGKQVKFPLSTHRSGGMSYFFEDSFEERDDLGSSNFFSEQHDILLRYQENKIDAVMAALSLDPEQEEGYSRKYQKYRILDEFHLTTDEIWTILNETKVFSAIYARIRRGQAMPQDWTVVLGTLSPCDKEARVVQAVLEKFPNYDEDRTRNNLKKFRERYSPATFGYLYYLYNLEMEDHLDPEMTGFSYLCKRLGIEEKTIEEKYSYNERNAIEDVRNTIEKEANYLLYNDEAPDIYIWNQLRTLKKGDRNEIVTAIKAIIEDGSYEDKPESFCTYNRVESDDKQRKLVSLSAHDRVLTTQLALELFLELKPKWDSFSYRPALTSKKDIFFQWYHSWRRYIESIRTFLEVPFFDNYEVIYIDLKQFYDHVDFLTIYETLKGSINAKAENILKYLVSYNDSLMAKINEGRRIGVPQGPAYARIISEIYLTHVLNCIRTPFIEDIYIMRYVDDIVVVCNPGVDGREVFDTMCEKLLEYGLPVNYEKSQYCGQISTLSDEQRRKLLHDEHFDYILRDDDQELILFDHEKDEKLSRYLEGNSFDMQSLGYIFGNHTIESAKKWYFEEFRERIISSCIGRGSNFRRFYEYVLSHEDYLSILLDEVLLNKIPLNTVNFSNFINSLYLLVQKHEIDAASFARIQSEFLVYILPQSLPANELAVLNALLMIHMEE